MSNKKETEMSISGSISRIAFFALGGFFLWQNRFKIQRLLEANGISTPWLKGDVAEAVQSGAAKLAGKFEGALKPVSHEESKVSSF